MIAGDINGDGRSNDRAYIFNATDPQYGAAMQSLLAASPKPIRDCLQRQQGRIAGRNSCMTPWTAGADAFVGLMFRPQWLGPTHGSTALSIQLMNPLSGLDQALGGALRTETWNRAAYSDPTMFYVRGFDPAGQRFLYDLNPNFGTGRNLSRRVRAPFGVRLDFTINYANMDAFYRKALLGDDAADGRGPDGAAVQPVSKKHTPAELRVRYAQRTPNPYAVVLRMDSTLSLTADERKALDSLSTQFAAKVDTLWTPFSEHVTARDDFDVSQAMTLTQQTLQRAQQLAQGAITQLKTMLTPQQFGQLPQWIREPPPVPDAAGLPMPGPGMKPGGRRR
jgi:hypothetical protein